MNNMRANILSVRRRILGYAVIALTALALTVLPVFAPSAYAEHEDGHNEPEEATPVPVPDDIADPIDSGDIEDFIGGL